MADMPDDFAPFALPITGNFDVTVEPGMFDRVREMFNIDGQMPTVHISGIPGRPDGQYRIIDFRCGPDGSFTFDLDEA